MENILKLHEAIAIVLLSQKNRTATIEDICSEVATRQLYFKKDGDFATAGQIRLRTHPNTKAGKTYHHWFEYIEPNKVKLRNL